MCGVLATLFLVIPAVEIYLIIKVGSFLGALPTLGIIAVTAMVGAYLAKQQGMAVLHKMRESMATGQGAGTAILEGVLILAAGITLLAPGFVTDAAGIALLIPPLRSALARKMAGSVSVQGMGAMGGVEFRHMGGMSGMPGAGSPFGAEDEDREDPPPPGVIDV